MDEIGLNFFGILSYLRMIQTQVVNEMGLSFVGQLFKFVPN